ncbi:hypothetical protein [Paraburkholderia phenazinium]|uniref:hypothetical protein n=1 Tax=Paraburkholderia phenazinium TaxID=60549 RepID=UPI00158B7E9B|nr:hypothetical protein [Paraburkholderia phenazinium]
MTSEVNLESRKAGFEQFYKELMPVLVDFVGKMGISPAHEVLRHAGQFVPLLSNALQSVPVENAEDRLWLLVRMSYFIGEYFAQKYGGCWYVNECPDSRYFGRYVVGRFAGLDTDLPMLDPSQVAQAYVDEPVPRDLEKLLAAVDAELADLKSTTAHRTTNPTTDR